MKSKEEKYKYDVEYHRTHTKRIPLDVRLAEYDTIKAAADAAGETVNGFIKRAIQYRINKGF